MSSERDILKSLLLKEELEVLSQLKQKILSEEQFTQEISRVLSGAIKRAQETDMGFERALAKPIKTGVTKAFTENKQSIVDSMLPIMGQLIRKTVTNSIKQFVSDINRVLEQRFSLKAIKWRWQAFKAGTSYAEMVFKKTISYQVKELFVINRENGLLIQHVGDNDMLIDNNAVSAMLTAIQDFIGDSLQTSESGLSSAAIGDVSYFISLGPKAYLATVIKGSATERLKEKSQQLIENIHAEFSELLTQEEKYQQDPEFDVYLRSHLLSKSISDTPKKVNWLPWIIGIVLLISGLIYMSYQKRQKFNALENLAQSIEGLYIKSIKQTDGQYIITGLLDPRADTTKLIGPNIVLNTQAFISLDPVIIKKRIRILLDNHKNINFDLFDGNLLLTGNIEKSASEDLLSELTAIDGIRSINNQLSYIEPQSIAHLLKEYQNKFQQMAYHFDQNTLTISGTVDYNSYQSLTQEIRSQYSHIKLNDSAILISDSTDKLINIVEASIINFPNEIEDNSAQYAKLADKIEKIFNRNNSLTLEIKGESDCYGKTSNQHSDIRAQSAINFFTQRGLDSKRLIKKIQPCVNYIIKPDLSKLNVTFDFNQISKADLQ
jgi:OOP family OmpA-OmpF porin